MVQVRAGIDSEAGSRLMTASGATDSDGSTLGPGATLASEEAALGLALGLGAPSKALALAEGLPSSADTVAAGINATARTMATDVTRRRI
jgi:hypothetical protein